MQSSDFKSRYDLRVLDVLPSVRNLHQRNIPTVFQGPSDTVLLPLHFPYNATTSATPMHLGVPVQEIALLTNTVAPILGRSLCGP